MKCEKVGAWFLLIKAIIHLIVLFYLFLNMACRNSRAHWFRVHVGGERTIPFAIYVVLALINFMWSIIMFLALTETDMGHLKKTWLSAIMIAFSVIFLAWEIAFALSYAINLRDINYAMLIYVLLLILILVYAALNIFMIHCVAIGLFGEKE